MTKRRKSPEDKISSGEQMWVTYCRQIAPRLRPGAYDPTFTEDRMFRIDFCQPDVKVAVVIEGSEC